MKRNTLDLDVNEQYWWQNAYFFVKPWQRRKQMRQQRKQWQRPTSCWFPSERRKALFFFFLKIFDLEDIYPAKIGAWVCDDNCGIFLRHPSCDVKCWTNLVLQHKILYVDMYVYRIHWYFVLAVLLLFLRHNDCKYVWWHQNSWYKNDSLTRQGWQLK